MKTRSVPINRIAHGRSGDKGNHANIAIIANTPASYSWLKEHLTVPVVAQYFASMGASTIERYVADNLFALNFVLKDILAGGASQSLRIDTQGKTLGLTLLQLKMEIPENLLT